MNAQEQIPMPCMRCGAPMREAGILPPRSIRIACAHCGYEETLPEEPASRVQALRARLARLELAQARLGRLASGTAKVMERVGLRGALLGSALLGLVLFAQVRALSTAWAGIAGLPLQDRLEIARQLTAGPVFSLSLIGGLVVAYALSWLRYRRRVRPLLLARPPAAQGSPARCRCCGGPLESTLGPFLDCPYCHAQNLVTAEVARAEATSIETEALAYDRTYGAAADAYRAAFDGRIFAFAWIGGLLVAVALQLLVQAALPVLVQ